MWMGVGGWGVASWMDEGGGVGWVGGGVWEDWGRGWLWKGGIFNRPLHFSIFSPEHSKRGSSAWGGVKISTIHTSHGYNKFALAAK